MEEIDKSREQLTKEVAALQEQVARLEMAAAARKQAGTSRNADLFQAEQPRSMELSTLLEAIRAVSSALDLEEVLTLIAEQTVKALGVSGCTISRWDRDANTIIIWSERRHDQIPADRPGTAYSLDDFPATRAVLETCQPLVVHISDPDADRAEIAHMRQVPTASLLMLPMAVGKRVIGLLELEESEHERRFTDNEIRLAQALANQAAIAIENAQLYEALEQELHMRAEAEEKLHRTHDRWEQLVSERTAELTAANEQLKQEISERRQAEEKVGAGEAKYRTLLEGVRDGVYTLDTKGNFTFVNDVIVQRSGQTRQWFLGRSYLDVIRPEDRERVRDNFEAVMRGETVPVYELAYPTASGSLLWVEVNTTALREGERIVGLHGLSRDITERKRIEETLFQSEARYRTVSELTSDFAYAFRIEPDGTLVAEWLTGAFKTITGFDPAEVQERGGWTSLFHPDDRPRVMERLRTVLPGQPDQTDLRITTKSGEVRWLHIRSQRIWDETEGRIVRLYGAATDISRQIRAEQLLKALNHASVAMGKALTPDEIFTALAEELHRLGFECMLLPTDESQSRLFPTYLSMDSKAIHAVEKLVGLTHRTFSIPIESVDLYREVVWERKTVLVDTGPHVMRQMLPPALRRWSGTVLRWVEIPRSIAAPLVVDDEVIGVLSVHSDDLIEDDIPAVTAFANQVAAAWHKAQLLDQARQEISERVRAEEALRESEALFHSLIESLPLGISSKDLEGRYTFANQHYCMAKGKPLTEIIGKTDYDLHPVEVAKDYRKNDLWIIDTGQVFELVEEQQVDGERLFVQVIKTPLNNAKGQVVGTLGIFWDITERKQAEEALRQSEARYHQLVELAPDLIAVHRDGIILFINEAGTMLLGGSSSDQIVGRSVIEFVSPAHRDIAKKRMRQLLETGERSPLYEQKLQRADGSEIDVDVIGTPITYQGKTAVLLICRDITERKRAEEALRESEEKFRAISTSAQDAIIMIDAHGHISYWNEAAQRIFGYSRAEALGQEAHTFLSPGEYYDAYRVGLETFKLTGKGPVIGRTLELSGVRKGGEEFPIELSLSSVKLAGSWSAIGIIRDITERKQTEETLHRRNAELELLNRIGQALNSTLDLDQVLATILDEVRHLLDVTICSVWLVDSETGELVCRQASGPRVHVMLGWRLAPEEGLGGWVAHHGKSLLVPDAYADERHSRKVEQQTGLALRSILSLPLHAKDSVIGVLQVGDSEVDRFRSTDLRLLESLAASAATAIENARLYEEIRTARDYARTVLDSLHDEVIIVDQQYRITDVNAALLRRTGYARQDVLGRSCYEISHRRDEICSDPDHPCPVAEVWRTGGSARGIHTHYDHVGEKAYVDIAASPLRDERGRVTHVIEAQRDVTAERQLQERLTAIQTLGQKLLFSRSEAEIARVVVDAAERVLEFYLCSLWLVNIETGTLTCQAATAAEKEYDTPVLHLDDKQGIIAAVAREGKAIYLPDVRQDSRYVDRYADTSSELCVPLKVRERVIGAFNAESDRLDAFDESDQQLFSSLADQAALALENAYLFEAVARGNREWEATFDAITDGIALIDAEFHVLRTNHTLAGWLHTTPGALIGRLHCELFCDGDFPPETWPHVQALQTGQPQSTERTISTLDGIFLISAYPLHDQEGSVRGVVQVFKDISKQKQMEQRLLQSERLSAMGRLAASVAHEINNPLQSVIGCLGLAQEELAEGQDIEQYLRIAHGEVRRAARTVSQLRSLGRQESREKAFTAVNALIEEVLALTKKQCQENSIEVIWSPAADLPLLLLAADQMKQVFLNLLFNAVEAMPEGGRLQVSTEYSMPSGGIYLRFADNGLGIAPDVLPHIFEPFYSTKREGLGLGLSISYGIIEQHGGHMEVDSQPGEGSRFTIWLPL